jgi:hypothetical protein
MPRRLRCADIREAGTAHWIALMWLLLGVAPSFAQDVDFAALNRYEAACVKLKAAILTDAGKALGKDANVIGWISECNGNIPACWDARKAIREAKRASPLDCLGRVQSHEAATAAYALYLEKAPDLPPCIERRC